MKLLFSSYHNYLDQTSGAAISLRTLLHELARQGVQTSTFCGSLFDSNDMSRECFLRRIKSLDPSASIDRCSVNVRGRTTPFELLKFNDGGIESTLFLSEQAFSLRSHETPASNVSNAFLVAFKERLNADPPDVYLSYGGYPDATTAATLAKNHGATNVFYLCNLAYRKSPLFDRFDRVVTPSEFAKERYQKILGIEPFVLPPIVDESTVQIESNSRKYLTFVNPSKEKGLYFFVGIAKALAAQRPEIPCLLVEARGKVDSLGGIKEATSLTNLCRLNNVSEPRAFYQESRILLAPSLCEETFGRVVVEAAFNRIPALCSRRGALPELWAGDDELANLLLDIPGKFTPEAELVPSEKEVQSWGDAILKLWDDDEYARFIGERLYQVSQRYSKEQVVRRSLAFFQTLERSNLDKR